MVRKKSELRAGPYYTKAVENIRRAMYECDPKGVKIDQKEIAAAVNMSPGTFSTKMRGIESHFYEDEFEAIAEFFRRKSGRPLTGFPHLDWQHMLTIDRKVAGWHP